MLIAEQADLNDPSTLKAALKGAYAVFAVTDFWAVQNAQIEINQGKAIADAAKVRSLQPPHLSKFKY